MLINFNEVEIGTVPIPTKRSKAEIGAALATILKKKIQVRAVLFNPQGEKN